MLLSEYEVYALSPLGRHSFQGYLKADGQKIILKRAENFSDNKIIAYLARIEMQGIPHIIGRTEYDNRDWLIFNWLEGEALNLQKPTPEKIINVLNNILKIIDTLYLLTGYYWLFLDFKMQHILLNQDEYVALIDFEHVYLSKTKTVDWQQLSAIGLNMAYCSAQIRQKFLSAKHHEYALALIALSSMIETDNVILNKKQKHKALKQFPENWQKRLKNALDGKGLREENVLSKTKSAVSGSNKYVPSNGAVDKSDDVDSNEADEVSCIAPNIRSAEAGKFAKPIETAKLVKVDLKKLSNISDLSEPFVFQHDIHLTDDRILSLQINLKID